MRLRNVAQNMNNQRYKTLKTLRNGGELDFYTLSSNQLQKRALDELEGTRLVFKKKIDHEKQLY